MTQGSLSDGVALTATPTPREFPSVFGTHFFGSQNHLPKPNFWRAIFFDPKINIDPPQPPLGVWGLLRKLVFQTILVALVESDSAASGG